MKPLSPIPFTFAPPLREPEVSEAVRRADPKNKREGLHPALRRKVEQLIDRAAAEGMRLYVAEGHRSFEAQARIPAANTNAAPGYSFHNYGLAVDLAFRDENGGPSWDEKHDWKGLGKLGKIIGLEWGGDWKRLVDRPHFQLPVGHGIAGIRQLYEKGGLPCVWENIK